jgi:hypothetical protein
MTSHFGLMIVFSLFVSLVFAVIAKDQPGDQLKAGAKLFGSFIAAAFVLGWVMRFFPL